MSISRLVRLARVFDSNTLFVMAGTSASILLRLISTILISRFLSPEAYGIVGVLISLSITITLLSDVGIYGFVVRHAQGDQHEFLDRVWTIRLIRCLILTLLSAMLAPVVSFALGKELTGYILVFSLTFAFEGLSSMAFATAARHGHVLKLTLMDLGPQLASFAIALPLAFLFRSPWALIISMITGSCSAAALSYALFPNSSRKWSFSRETLHEAWQFGRNLNMSSSLHLAITQADKLLLARLFSTANFGLYSMASGLIATAQSFNSLYVKRILYPAFARANYENLPSASSTYYQTGRSIRLTYSFLCGVMLTSAPLIVKILYDDRYAFASVYLQVLSIGLLFSISAAAANEFMLSLGKTGHVLSLNLVRFAYFCVCALSLGIFFGPIGIVIAAGTTDCAAQLYCWVALSREGLLDVRKEIIQLLSIGCGLVIGSVANSLAQGWAI